MDGDDDAPEPGCPECPFVQTYTWGVFWVIMMMSWDAAMPRIIDRLNDDTVTAETNEEPVKRTYIIILAVFAVVLLWIRIIFYMVFGYVACAVVAMAANYVGEISAGAEKAMLWMSNASFIFDCVTTKQLPFHAAISVVAIVYAVLTTMLYVQTSDLQPGRTVKLRAKAVRILFAMPFFMSLIYAVYAIYNIWRTV
jgi:hypothetical protein